MPRTVFSIALLLCGCGTLVTYTPLDGGSGRGHRRPAEEVDVYLSGPPNRPHTDAGLLEAEQESDLSLDDTREMLRKLRIKAGRVGCDAIFVKGVGSNAQPALLVTDMTSSTKTITATCIHYTETETPRAQRRAQNPNATPRLPSM